MIKFLVRRGANTSIKDNEGKNVIHASAQSEQVASIYYFLTNHNMNVDEGDNNGSTALHWAAYLHCEISLTYLIAWGAGVNIQDIDGNTPLHLAVLSDGEYPVR